MLEILKASAGSGKTFNLAKTYIGMVFRSEDPYAYRHILAVTFTNKATDEMKSRILKELDILATSPEKSGYYKEFSAEFGGAAALKKKAYEVLVNILHDYNAFSISTIDKFFQMTLKSFAREIGQVASYQIDLDKKSLVKESVDRILDSLSEDNPKLLSWLKEYAMEQISENGRYSLEPGLYEMAADLESEKLATVLEKHGLDLTSLYSNENLTLVRKACREYRDSFTDAVIAAAERVNRVFTDNGLTVYDTTRGFMKIIPEKYMALKRGDMIDALTEAFVRNAGNPDNWFPKKNAGLHKIVDGVLDGPLEAFVSLMDKGLRPFNTAGVILRQLYCLGIASRLHKEYEALIKEKNVITLDDSNSILRTIIGEDDAPFIYEKLGVRYENFLLDEFQDTSTVQWENFRPLLRESLSHSEKGRVTDLIVGDIKQSIYRWRGSDWNLLGTEVKKEFGNMADDTRALSENWRSCRNIVEFNNSFFSYAASVLDKVYGEGAGIGDIYGDVAQKPMARTCGDGSLEFTFCPKDSICDEVVSAIRRVMQDGNAGYGDIAVLVRSNNEGASLASVLADNGIPVISDDSLSVKSSICVRRVVSLMSRVANPGDTVGAYLAGSLDIAIPESYHSLIDLAEEFIRKMEAANPGCLEGEIYHIQSFMDVLGEWVSLNGNNLASFLDYWKEQDPKLSSPADPEAVRIMTIHKSKGLEFGYVIFPFAHSVELFPQRNTVSAWCIPETEGTDFPKEALGVYKTNLSRKENEPDLFDGAYLKERRMQFIDNLNVTYVALTRASRGLHVIAENDEGCSAFHRLPMAPSPQESAGYAPEHDYKNMAQILYGYLCVNQGMFDHSLEEGVERFSYGEMFDFRKERMKAKEGLPDEVGEIVSGYPSFPLNPAPVEGEDVRERGRLKFSADSVDFFSEEGESARHKGTVLHAILSSVNVPGDLPDAVRAQVACGALPEDRAPGYEEFLRERLESVRDRGWYSCTGVSAMNEVSIIDTDGSLYRPDRVVISGKDVCVIDYKFGGEDRRYLRQIGRYASLYRAMGYDNVEACIWYVNENKIVSL